MKNYGYYLLFIVITAFSIRIVEAETLYEVRHRRGVVTFTSKRPPAGASYREVKKLTPRKSNIIIRKGSGFKPRKSEFDPLIFRVSTIHGVDPALVKAVVHIESSFQSGARSHKGAMGLMQLMPATAKRWGVENAYQPDENVSGGVQHLKMLLERYRGNLTLVLAAYNAGEYAVDRYQGIPPYAETQDYVRKGLKMLEVYRANF